jgi:hypothetical protein
MRFSWRDAVETVLVALVVVAVIGVVQERDWALLGSDRAAAATVFAIGFVMCQVGMRTQVREARDLVRGPFMLTATVLGPLALVLAIAGVAFPARWIVVALGVTLVATWFVATIHHAIGRPLAHPA